MISRLQNRNLIREGKQDKSAFYKDEGNAYESGYLMNILDCFAGKNSKLLTLT